MADRAILPVALDSNGNIVSGARAYFFERGTVTPLTVYKDEGATTPHSTPVVADAAGVFPPVFSVGPFKVDIRDAVGASLPGYPSDPGYISTATSPGASGVTFSPIFGNPASNVQSAIANLTTLWNAVTTFGRSLIASADAATAQSVLNLKAGAVAEKATEAQAQAGTDDAAYMTPLRVKDAISSIQAPSLMVFDQKPNGTAGGALAANAWTTRDLNTTGHNNIAGASLSGNAVTLPAGTYDMEARSIVGFVGATRLRLNGSVSGALAHGAPIYVGSGGSSSEVSVSARVTLASSQAVSVQQIIGTTRGTADGGSATGLGNDAAPEIYTTLKITKAG